MPFWSPFRPRNPAADNFKVYLAGVARALIENVTKPGRPSPQRLARAAGSERVGDRVDQLASSRGNGYIRNLLAEVGLIAHNFDGASVEVVKRHLISVLGTVNEKGTKSQRLSARIAVSPYDAHRLHLFDVLRTTLRDSAPIIRPVLSDQRRLEWLLFFEAYSSNYIEGTVFGLDEAREIVMDGKIPPARPADAHDVTATYRIVSDDTEMRLSPRTYRQFEELLRARHAVLMAGRDNKRPGEFKEVANSAGGYRFVEPELLAGTFARGIHSPGRNNRSVSACGLHDVSRDRVPPVCRWEWAHRSNHGERRACDRRASEDHHPRCVPRQLFVGARGNVESSWPRTISHFSARLSTRVGTVR